jgi:hypothetical protein
MTREEQIIEASQLYAKHQQKPFMDGALWADANPNLYSVTRKAVEREREYLIGKFCEFMQSCEGYVVSGEKCNYDNFIKFMEEQQ